MGVETAAEETPMAPIAVGQKKFSGMGSTMWSALTAALKMFGLEATTKEFSNKLLKWMADVVGESTIRVTFKTQEVEAANLQVFVGMVNGDAELKLSHSMVKYNDLFVASNLSGNVIEFMGDRPLDGRSWVLKIPLNKSWEWPEVRSRNNPIEM